ncbi:MAG: NAD-dependent epimerase/dehydratase family protein [bacterium]
MSRPIFDRKNILITGGAGFIGSHLCDELVKEHKVICLDNFLTGQEENINHLLQNPNFEFIKHDFTEPIDFENELGLKPFQVEFQGIQEIYHLASPASPKDYLDMPIETLMSNARATLHSLELAKKYQARLVFTSSATIYGSPLEKTPYPENYWGYVDPIGPHSALSEGKRFAESLMFHYRKKHKINAKIARIFKVYGPRLRINDGRMIPEMIIKALNNEQITVYGETDETISACYVSDIVEGLIRLMKSNELGPINLGTSEERPLKEMAEIIKKLSNSNSKIKLVSGEKGDFINHGTPNIRLAKEHLGWFPVVSLEDGLSRTIDYFKGVKNITIKHFESSINQTEKSHERK